MKRIVALLLVLLVNQAYGQEGKAPASGYKTWKSECSSCHVAYPPQMLSGENWQQLMGRLDKHFDSNATLDKADNKAVLGFLLSNAGSGEHYSAASLRISDTPWFKREHHVIAESEWGLPEVKSKSNCGACHGKGVLGD